jgi:hypothetical protein
MIIAVKNNQETFILDYSRTPTDLKLSCEGFQLAQINIMQQAFKELLFNYANVLLFSAILLHT